MFTTRCGAGLAVSRARRWRRRYGQLVLPVVFSVRVLLTLCAVKRLGRSGISWHELFRSAAAAAAASLSDDDDDDAFVVEVPTTGTADDDVTGDVNAADVGALRVDVTLTRCGSSLTFGLGATSGFLAPAAAAVGRALLLLAAVCRAAAAACCCLARRTARIRWNAGSSDFDSCCCCCCWGWLLLRLCSSRKYCGSSRDVGRCERLPGTAAAPVEAVSDTHTIIFAKHIPTYARNYTWILQRTDSAIYNRRHANCSICYWRHIARRHANQCIYD